MTTLIAAHGFEFLAEAHGFAHHEQTASDATNDLRAALEALPAADVAALHAGLAAFERDDPPVEFPDLAETLCIKALAPHVADWHNPGAAALSLSAL